MTTLQMAYVYKGIGGILDVSNVCFLPLQLSSESMSLGIPVSMKLLTPCMVNTASVLKT